MVCWFSLRSGVIKQHTLALREAIRSADQIAPSDAEPFFSPQNTTFQSVISLPMLFLLPNLRRGVVYLRLSNGDEGEVL